MTLPNGKSGWNNLNYRARAGTQIFSPVISLSRLLARMAGLCRALPRNLWHKEEMVLWKKGVGRRPIEKIPPFNSEYRQAMSIESPARSLRSAFFARSRHREGIKESEEWQNAMASPFVSFAHFRVLVTCMLCDAPPRYHPARRRLRDYRIRWPDVQQYSAGGMAEKTNLLLKTHWNCQASLVNLRKRSPAPFAFGPACIVRCEFTHRTRVG